MEWRIEEEQKCELLQAQLLLNLALQLGTHFDAVPYRAGLEKHQSRPTEKLLWLRTLFWRGFHHWGLPGPTPHYPRETRTEPSQRTAMPPLYPLWLRALIFDQYVNVYIKWNGGLRRSKNENCCRLNSSSISPYTKKGRLRIAISYELSVLPDQPCIIRARHEPHPAYD